MYLCCTYIFLDQQQATHVEDDYEGKLPGTHFKKLAYVTQVEYYVIQQPNEISVETWLHVVFVALVPAPFSHII